MKKTFNIIILTLLTAAIGYASLFNFYLNLQSSLLQTTQLALFLLLGILFLAIERKSALTSFQSRFFFSVLQFIILFLTLFIVYSFYKVDTIFLVLASASAFLFPKVLSFSWETYNLVFQSAKKIWYVTKTTQGAVNFLYGMPVQLKLSLKHIERRKKLFPIKAPLSMKLGEFFNHFLATQNSKWEKIQVTKNDQQVFGWEFFEESLGGLRRRRLDPDLNLMDNDVKANATIVAARIAMKESKEEALL